MQESRTRTSLVWWIVGAAIVIRLLLFGYLWAQHDPGVFVFGDANGYMRIAQNLAAGHGFSQATVPPYLPDSERTILFPFVLSISLYLFHSYIPLILLQFLAAGLFVFLTYKIGLLVTKSEELSLYAALLMAVEPYSIFINTSVLTETTFTTFLLSGIYFCVRFIKEIQWHQLALASVLFGFAALTRPIGEFLPLVLLVVVALCVPWRAYLKYAALAVIPFLIVISPWLIRNQTTFGVAVLSSSGFQNVYSDLGGAIVAYHDHISSDAGKDKLEAEYEQQHNTNPIDIQRNLAYAPSLFKEGLGIMATYPVDTIKVFTSITVTFFTNDAWVYYLQLWHILPTYGGVGFSPSYTLMTEGPVVTFEKTIAIAGVSLPLAIAGRLFWILTSAFFFVGVIALIVRGGESRRYGIFFALMVLYLLALSSSVGFGINGRFRYPVDSLFFISAVLGMSVFFRAIKRRLARAHR